MQIREASLDLTRILAYPAIPFDLTSREIATGNRAIAFRTDWIIYREFKMPAALYFLNWRHVEILIYLKRCAIDI